MSLSLASIWFAIKFKLRYGSSFEVKPWRCEIHPGVSVSIRKGGRVVLGTGVCLRSGVSLSANGGLIDIQDGAFINRNSSLNSHHSIVVGKDVLVGENVCIYDHDHEIRDNGVSKSNFIVRPVTIGDGAWLGTGVIVLKGVNIGSRAVIGAGSILTRDVPQECIVVQKRVSTVVTRRL